MSSAGVLGLLGPAATASAAGDIYNCGTEGFYYATISLHQATTAKKSGSCGRLQVRAYYTVTTTGKQYWSGWKGHTSKAEYKTSYGITRSEHLTTYTGVLRRSR